MVGLDDLELDLRWPKSVVEERTQCVYLHLLRVSVNVATTCFKVGNN